MEFVRTSCLDRSNPLCRSSCREEEGHDEHRRAHDVQEVESSRAILPRQLRVHGPIDAILAQLEHQDVREEEKEDRDAGSRLEDQVGQKRPTVHVLEHLVLHEVSDKEGGHGADDQHRRHGEVDEQAARPQEEGPPDEDDALPTALDGCQDAREVVLEEDELAEAEGVALRLRPPRADRLRVGLALRRVVHHSEEDRLDPDAPACSEEALDAHVPILRDPIGVPSLHGFGQDRGD
mmetsp:Transcript_64501/g.162321  ORF Transcript_64501/g.162321 Transcript_64501/m.162321 type:complete len:235 (-) Transcript_64501:547-1251(-)